MHILLILCSLSMTFRTLSVSSWYDVLTQCMFEFEVVVLFKTNFIFLYSWVVVMIGVYCQTHFLRKSGSLYHDWTMFQVFSCIILAFYVSCSILGTILTCLFTFPWLAQRGGCIIVDSTRKGKRFPDSMSKTIPIWTCVLNRAIHNYKRILESLDTCDCPHNVSEMLLIPGCIVFKIYHWPRNFKTSSYSLSGFNFIYEKQLFGTHKPLWSLHVVLSIP